MVQGNASMYLGSPRMAEMVIGEKVSLEDMGGARMHTTESGCGDVLVKTEQEALAFARRYLSYLPHNREGEPPALEPGAPRSGLRALEDIIVKDENKPFDMMEVIEHVVDEGSVLELKARYAKELITAFCRIDGRVVGIIANQPKYLGGVLFVNSADKAARFIQLCNAFNVPLLFLADVPGFMIGSKVEKQGIIRAGAKMVMAVSMATVPRISVVVRKAYGAGLYAMCGPAFDPDACLALPTAQIAVMGPSAAVNAVYYNKIQAAPEAERAALTEQLREEYRSDIDLGKLASELVVDEVIPFDALRSELSRRFELVKGRRAVPIARKHPIVPM
jgi:acetyl-CoA carboxylase carboxyltransferase component